MMTDEVTVREARPSDLPALEIVRRQAIEDGFSRVYERNQFADLVAGPSQRLGEWVDSESVAVLMVETKYTPVSFGAVHRDEGEVCALYTAPEYQGEGCGTELLGRLERVLRRLSKSVVTLGSPRNAEEFFRKQGYEKIGVSTEGPVETVRMSKNLTAE